MPGVVAVDVAEGAVKLSEGDLYRSSNIRNIFGSENNEGTVTGAALCITGEFNLKYFTVRRLNRLVGCEDTGRLPVRPPRMPIERNFLSMPIFSCIWWSTLAITRPMV